MKLLQVMEKICDIYYRLTLLWKKSYNGQFSFNQKKFIVKNIETNENVYNNSIQYREFLSENYDEICEVGLIPNIECRIKALNSIESKISGYSKSKKHEYGRIPFNKCLNDILGFRYITNNKYNIFEIKDLVTKLKTDIKITPIVAIREDYKAIHIYFRLDNFSYQWELQIWNINDAATNLKSHEKYKQKYTTAEKEYKEGGYEDV